MKPSFIKMTINITAKLIKDGEVRQAVYGKEIDVDPQEPFLRDIEMALEENQDPFQKLIRLANLGSKNLDEK